MLLNWLKGNETRHYMPLLGARQIRAATWHYHPLLPLYQLPQPLLLSNRLILYGVEERGHAGVGGTPAQVLPKGWTRADALQTTPTCGEATNSAERDTPPSQRTPCQSGWGLPLHCPHPPELHVRTSSCIS